MTEPAQPDPPVIGERGADVIRRGGRPTPRKRSFIILKWTGIVALIAVSAGWFGLNAWFTYDYFFSPDMVEPKAFGSEDWKKLSEPWTKARQLTRHSMAEDLLAKYDLKGKSRGAILDLLGPSDRKAMFSRDTVPYAFSYLLGPRGVDHWWLVIEFNRNDFVVSASIVGD
jgi:hypothetical protein